MPDAVYFERLKAAILQLGRYPKTSERKKFGLNFKKSRFPTLRAFIAQAEQLGVLDGLDIQGGRIPTTASEISTSESSSKTHLLNDQPYEPARSVPPIPTGTKRVNWKRINVSGFPYAPHDELGVVALLAILCSQQKIDWQILELNGGKGIDAKCFDRGSKKEIRVEVKYILSRTNWNHSIEDVDYIVCWENRWRDFPKPVLALREIVSSSP